MKSMAHHWEPGAVRCCACERPLEVTRTGDAVSAGAGILPSVPGAVCDGCLAHADGLAVADLRAPAAVHILVAQEFERRTVTAVQALLDLYGWEPEVVSAGALRLHADGKARDAYRLLDAAAAAAADGGYYLVEKAALLMLDGETGRAHDLLLETDADDHPRWHLVRGNLAHAVGRPDAAREHWREQVQANPEEPLGWQTLGWHLLHEQQDATAAAACFSGACGIFPQHQEFRAWFGEALYRQGRNAEALAELEQARALEPVDAEFSRGLDALLAEVRQAVASGGED